MIVILYRKIIISVIIITNSTIRSQIISEIPPFIVENKYRQTNLTKLLKCRNKVLNIFYLHKNKKVRR